MIARPGRALTGLTLGLATLLGCAQEPSSAPAFRRLFEDAERVDARLGRDNRQTVLIQPGDEVRESIEVPSTGRVALSYGLNKGQWRRLRRPIVVSIVARRADGGTIELHRDVLRRGGRDGAGTRWREAEIDLAAMAGEQLELTIAASWGGNPDGGLPATPWPNLYIGSPVLYSSTPPQKRPNVLLIGIDTLRADRLGAYGAEPSPSPTLDELARRGTLFERAFSQSNYTLPGFASIFTGLYPSHHLAVFQRRLPAGALSLPGLFGGDGYYTIGFHNNGYMSPSFGWSADFDAYNSIGGMRAADRIADWIDGHRGLPWLLFVHTYDTHSPYASVPAEYHRDLPAGDYDDVWRLKGRTPGRVIGEHGSNPFGAADYEFMLELYDAEIRFVDDQLAHLVERLGGWSLLDDTLVVVVSDHGEEFGEHGGIEHHGTHLHREQLHVPLIVAGPGVAAGHRIARAVETIDLLPSLAEHLGLTAPGLAEIDGRSFASAWGKNGGDWAGDGERDLAISELPTKGRWALRAGRWALHSGPDGSQLFDTEADPHELVDLAAERPELVDRLHRLFEETVGARDAPPPPDTPLDEETLRELRAMGYVD
jgi:arylsulfatase A-like enzyme